LLQRKLDLASAFQCGDGAGEVCRGSLRGRQGRNEDGGADPLRGVAGPRSSRGPHHTKRSAFELRARSADESTCRFKPTEAFGEDTLRPEAGQVHNPRGSKIDGCPERHSLDAEAGRS